MKSADDNALRYTRLFETAQDGILILNHPDGAITDANPYIQTLTGYRLEELKGKKLWELGLIQDLMLAHTAHDTLISQGFVRYDDINLLTKDGRSITTEFICNSYDVAGTQVIQCNIRDTSEKVALQKHLAAAHQRELDQSLQTINALANVIESRDPYTSGHQYRVADLAIAIGKELGLEDHLLKGLRLACLVHDIGKIAIPSELLTKPTPLSELEVKLLQTHVEAGANILKPLTMVWPIAKIIEQHHERLNGTGYPNGLSGDEILIEAKIMAVADTVEAMSSNRPYRPSLGIDAALKEITQGEGIFYDTRVVSACLRLFKELHYALPDRISMKFSEHSY